MSHMGKTGLQNKRKYIILLAVEGILVCLLILNLFGKDAVITIEQTPATEGGWAFREDLGGWYTAEQDGAGSLTFGNISLKAGTYRICLQYTTDTFVRNMCEVSDETVSYGGVATNGTHLYAGKENTDYMMWLKEDTQGLAVKVSYSGEGSLLIKGLTVYETNAGARVALFLAVVCCMCIDAALICLEREKKKGVNAEKRNVALMLGITVLAASLPLMTNYLIGGGDIIFHLMRIEGIKDGILSGQFPVRIAPEWLYGHGYASSVFYGDTLLYLPALLRLIGFTVQDSYKIFIFLLHVSTCAVSYVCFRKIFSNRYLGAFCSVLYTMSVYRIYVTYCRAALGEAEAMVFLPLLVYGFYRVYTEDCHERRYRSAWIPLTAGYCGLIQSHILSCELIGGFSVLLCLVLWKKTFRRQTFAVLLKAVCLACAISAWFIVPFLDYMLRGDFVIHHVSGRTIQDRGLYPAHLLFTFFRRGGNSVFGEQGMVSTDPAGVGISLMAALFFFLGYLWIGGKDVKKEKYVKVGKAAAGVAVLAMVFSLQMFPWDKLQRMNGIFATLISSIQFPSRFLAAATVSLTLVAGVSGALIWHGKDRIWRIGYGCACISLVAVSGLYLVNDILAVSQYFKLYNEESMAYGYIAGAEYLPAGTDAGLLEYSAPEGSALVEVKGWEKEYLHVMVNCENGGEEGYVEVPMLYYRGYQAFAAESPLTVCPGNNNTVRVMLPAGFDGLVEVGFHSPWHWRLAELVSLVTLCACAAAGVYRKRAGKERSGNERQS